MIEVEDALSKQREKTEQLKEITKNLDDGNVSTRTHCWRSSSRKRRRITRWAMFTMGWMLWTSS